MAATVKVQGSAIVPAQPDEVSLALTLDYLAPTPEDALAEIARRGETLDAVFARLDIEPRQRTTSGISIAEEHEWQGQDRGNVHRGYRATNRIQVRHRDAGVIAQLMNAATREARATIAGPWWRVAPDNAARTEAYRLAALDARRRAEAYASAIGARLGPVIAIVEPGLEDAPPPQPRPMAKAMRAMANEMAVPDVAIESGEQDVATSVIVTFALEQG